LSRDAHWRCLHSLRHAARRPVHGRAQKEREAISERTKAALAAAKARGTELGNPNGAAHLRHLGNAHAVAGVKAKAQERAEGVRSTIEAIQARGITSARGIAGEFNRAHIATARGGTWTARRVIDLLARL
jgi:DNA invertase Pin-like site-specific DNA recombinase